jgi:Tfp pilus assembly protein PilO
MSNIVSIIFILMSFGAFFGYVDPTYSKVKVIRAEKADYERALNNSKELQTTRDALDDKYNKIEEPQLEKLSKLIPDNIDNVRLVIDIDEIAKKYQMRIRNFKTEALAKKDTIGKDSALYGTLNLQFSTTASYNTFLAFMSDLEHSLRIIDVSAIAFASSDTNQLYDYNVTIKTYWLK